MFRRILHCGIEKKICDRECDRCNVRFKCYTEAIFYPLVLTPEEWRVYHLRVISKINLDPLWGSDNDGELYQSVKLASQGLSRFDPYLPHQ